MEFKYQATVIVPVYNVEDYLKGCLDSLVNQTIDKSQIEVLLIDDGSTDSSPEICDEYAEKHPIFKAIHVENGGVSAARNLGIDKAQGKYILFLDSDDYLSDNTVKDLVDFFDKYYDEVDIITYNQKLVKNGEVKKSGHYRYKYVNKSGVYDLNDPDYMYFVQTNMNICVKNIPGKNTKFNTGMMFHEDQEYILSKLADKGKMGFCDSADYFYVKDSGGVTVSHNHPYYIFDKTIEFWEYWLSSEVIPKYVQIYFLNDFKWKLCADLLWPYQYKDEDFKRESGRIISLLKKVDDDAILNFPRLTKAHQTYIFGLKYGDQMAVQADSECYKICRKDESLLEFENIEIYVSRFHVRNNQLTMIGVIKCLACNFTEDIKLNVTYTGNEKKTETLPLRHSSLSIFASKTNTNNFKMFVIKRPVDGLKKIEFSTELMGHKYPARLTFPQSCPFCRGLKRMSYVCEGMRIKCDDDSISFKKANVFNKVVELFRSVVYAPKIGYRNALTRIIAPHYKRKNRIWLYCDSSKTVKDNAYYQFLHDAVKDDGIQRFYVVNADADITGWFDDSLKDKLVIYGSLRHRLLGLSAEKIITSFYGLRDILSYPYGAMKYFADITNFDVIYLQHGVLHAHLPTMYSLDRMMIDKEVISTDFERENLTRNYCFDESFLIKSGMPRYDHIDTSKPAEKKILFAPSWRKFLVSPDGKGSWIPNEKAFLNSDFYKNTMSFLTNPRLENALKKHGYVLDFKPHPNFRMYDELFNLNGETVRLAPKTVDEFSYGVFITDFSSFVFDFVYLKRPILYFVPDMELFEAGLNHYRKLDIPFEEGFGEFASDCEKAVDDVIALLENGCVPEKKYVDRMNGLFLDVKEHEEELYKALMSE